VDFDHSGVAIASTVIAVSRLADAHASG